MIVRRLSTIGRRVGGVRSASWRRVKYSTDYQSEGSKNHEHGDNKQEDYKKRPRLFTLSVLFTGVAFSCVPLLAQYYMQNVGERVRLGFEPENVTEESLNEAKRVLDLLCKMYELSYFDEDTCTEEFARKFLAVVKSAPFIVHEPEAGGTKHLDEDPLYVAMSFIGAAMKANVASNERTFLLNAINNGLMETLLEKIEECVESKSQSNISFEDLEMVSANRNLTGRSATFDNVDLHDVMSQHIIAFLVALNSDPTLHTQILNRKSYIQKMYKLTDCKCDAVREFSVKCVAKLFAVELKYPNLFAERIDLLDETKKFVESEPTSDEASSLKSIIQADTDERKRRLAITPQMQSTKVTNVSYFDRFYSTIVPSRAAEVALTFAYVAIRWRFNYKINPLNNSYFRTKVVPPLLAYTFYTCFVYQNLETATNKLGWNSIYKQREKGFVYESKALEFFLLSKANIAVDLILYLFAYRYARFMFIPMLFINREENNTQSALFDMLTHKQQ